MMIVLVTQAGICYVGAHYDTASITEPELFAKCLHEGFDEVLALRPAPRSTRRPPAKKSRARATSKARSDMTTSPAVM